MLGFGPDTEWRANSTGGCGEIVSCATRNFPKLKTETHTLLLTKCQRLLSRLSGSQIWCLTVFYCWLCLLFWWEWRPGIRVALLMGSCTGGRVRVRLLSLKVFCPRLADTLSAELLLLCFSYLSSTSVHLFSTSFPPFFLLLPPTPRRTILGVQLTAHSKSV